MKTGREKTIKYNSSIGGAVSINNNAFLKSHPDIHPSPSTAKLSYLASFVQNIDMRNKITLIFVKCNAHNLSSGPTSFISLTRILENLVHFTSVDTEPLQLVLVAMPLLYIHHHITRLTGVTHSLHPHCTPAQSKLPILTPHFSLGQTNFPATCPFERTGSIHVS